MASPDKKTFEIADAFTRYLESKDVNLINEFSRTEIEIALLQLINDGKSPYYIAMQIRREKLKEEEKKEGHKPAKWKTRMKAVMIGVIAGLILLLLKLINFS
ncbi:MAG: hypothetical protein JRJ85_12290 [Deltaproteobacteria bacterium]|nr:hypothetical protein [Deltaproteobacteria bacterium]